MISDYSTLWYVVMISAALKAVARLRTRSVLLAAVFLLALFLGVPLFDRFGGA